MSSTADTVAALQALVSSLPEGTNPYSAIDAWLWSSLDKGLPQSFYVQLYILSGGLGFNLLVVLVTLTLQLLFRRFWFFRLEAGALKPHGTIPWLVGGGLWYVFAEVVIWRSMVYYRGEGVVRELIGFRTFMWWAPWTAGWIAAHALSSGFLTHLSSTGFLKLHVSQSYQRTLTYFFYATLLVFYASTAPFCVIAVKRYARSLDAFEEIDTMLKAAAASYGGTFDMSGLSAALPALEQVTSEQNKLIKTMGYLYTLYGTWGIVLGLAVGSAAFLHTRSLAKTLRQAEELKAGATINHAGDRQTAQFRKTYKTLVFTMWAFSAICSGFTAVSFFVGLRTSTAMNNTIAIQAVDLTMYWLYLLAGFPVGLLVLWRVLRAYQADRSHSSSQLSFSFPSSPTNSRKQRRVFSGSSGSHAGRDINIDVSTVVAVHTLTDVERDSTAGGGVEGFEMLEGKMEYPRAADGGFADVCDARVKELYFLELEQENSRENREKMG
ncbi:hypothetical protein JCM8547_004795 [Rhodosporidiobolus lusitaniae]